MSSTRLILVRHGETTWNVEGRYQGHADSPLTETGVVQARALAERFARETFSTLYSSDLDRARQTAETISAKTGHEVRVDDRLRERGLGVLQGLLPTEAKARLPEDYHRFVSGDCEYVPAGGESTLESVGRFSAGLLDLAQAHPGQTIAVVTHGGVLGSFLRHVLGIGLEAPRRYKRFNASWNVFSFEKGHWFLHTWGDIGHLGEARSLDDV